jgi:protoheme IX farnesyltransferase
MSQAEAYIFAYTAGAIGVAMMWYFFNAQSALISALSLFIYSFIYTPLKQEIQLLF